MMGGVGSLSVFHLIIAIPVIVAVVGGVVVMVKNKNSKSDSPDKWD